MHPNYLSLLFFPVDTCLAHRKYPPVSIVACPNLALLHSATLPLASPARSHIGPCASPPLNSIGTGRVFQVVFLSLVTELHPSPFPHAVQGVLPKQFSPYKSSPSAFLSHSILLCPFMDDVIGLKNKFHVFLSLGSPRSNGRLECKIGEQGRETVRRTECVFQSSYCYGQKLWKSMYKTDLRITPLGDEGARAFMYCYTIFLSLV